MLPHVQARKVNLFQDDCAKVMKYWECDKSQASSHQWCKGLGCRVHPKFWFVENLGKIPKNQGKTPEYPDKNCVQRCLILKNGAQRLLKNTWRHFFGVHTEKGLHDLCGRKSVGKVAYKRFGKIWENSGKNPSHPQNFAYSYTYVSHDAY